MPVGQQNLHFMYRWRHRTKEVLSSKSCHTFWLLNHYFDAFFQRLYFLNIFWILDFHSTVFYILHHLIVSFFIFHYLAFFITTTFYIITLFHLRLALLMLFLWFSLILHFLEAAIQRCSQEKVFWKYAANLLENTHAEVWFQWSCKATLLKLYYF